MSQSKRYTVTIPAEVWEMSMCDAEKLAQVHKECVRLAAENERLRKAGDAVTLCLCADTDEQHKRRCAINWLAAKEGRDAK